MSADRTAPFTDMAKRIELNADNGFSGAFVVVPPGEDAQPRVMLVLDNVGNPGQFWGMLMAHCQMAIQELENENRQRGPFG
jgi:hypothetical protein